MWDAVHHNLSSSSDRTATLYTELYQVDCAALASHAPLPVNHKASRRRWASLVTVRVSMPETGNIGPVNLCLLSREPIARTRDTITVDLLTVGDDDPFEPICDADDTAAETALDAKMLGGPFDMSSVCALLSRCAYQSLTYKNL